MISSNSLAITNSLFEIIYQAAKEKNAKKIISLNTCVDLQFQGLGTPATVLAKEADHDAVNFLKTEFNASVIWIAYGYALVGNVNKCNQLLASVLNHPLEQRALYVKIASGYICGGFVDEANMLSKQCGNAYLRGAIADAIAGGFARTAQIEKANECLELVLDPTDKSNMLDTLAYNYSFIGNHIEVKKIYDIAKTPNLQLQLLKEIAKGYSNSGCVNLNEDFLKLAAASQDNFLVMRYVIHGYLVEGYLQHANTLMESMELSPDDRILLFKEMILGAAQGGHVFLINEIMKVASTPETLHGLLVWMVFGYALCGHEYHTHKSINSARSDEEDIVLRRQALTSFIRGGYIGKTNKVLQLCSTHPELHSLIKIVAIELKKIVIATPSMSLHALASFHPEFQMLIVGEARTNDEINIDLTSLIPTATRIQKVMLSQRINYRLGFAWNEPSVQYLLLKGHHLLDKYKLTNVLLLTILSYIAPLNPPEIMELYHRFLLKFCRNQFLSNSVDLAEVIYQAAKEKNSAKIRALLPHVTIGIELKEGWTAVTKLATERNIEAVNFLITEFDASLYLAAYGYALKGYTEEATNILEKVSSTAEQFIMSLWMMYAYARSNNLDEMNKISNKFTNRTQQFILKKWKVGGYARAGNIKEVNKILESDCSSERLILMKEALEYYVRSGFLDEANKILSNAVNPIQKRIFIECFAMVYARQSQYQEANALLQSLQNPGWRQAVMVEMVCNYGFNGDIEAARKVCDLADNLNDRLKLIKCLPFVLAAAGRIDTVNKLIDSALNVEERHSVSMQAASGYAIENQVVEENNILNLAENTPHRYEILKEIGYSYAKEGKINKVNEIKNFFVNTDDLNIYLKRIIEGYAKAGLIEQVNELCDFYGGQNANRIELMLGAVKGYTISGLMSEVTFILSHAIDPEEQFILIKQIVQSSAYNGFLDEIFLAIYSDANTAHQVILLKLMVNALEQSKEFNSASSTLQILSLFQPYMQKIMAEKIDQNKDAGRTFEAVSLLPKAEKLEHLYLIQNITYKQAIGWFSIEVKIWLLQANVLVEKKHLDLSVYLKILSYLVHVTNIESINSSNKFPKLFCRSRLFFPSVVSNMEIEDSSLQESKNNSYSMDVA
jgi:hypothetical protein